jgi:hypothetical protein
MRSSHTIITSATLFALVASPLASAEMHVNDLRLGLGTQDTHFIDSSTADIGRDADKNWRGQLQFVKGDLGLNGGWIFGAGLSLNHVAWNNGFQEVRVTSPTIDVLAGYGYAFTPGVHMELTPFIGFGRSYYNLTDTHSSNVKEWVHYYEYGVKLGAYADVADGLLLGLEVPFLVGRIDPEYTYVDTGNPSLTISEKRRIQGFGLLAIVGYRF